ncbi:meiosis arrest female protein 1 homolog [Phalaenopsis equestris]|uniref:meiosis arrest female protein 1 homolog n=1 Tax=Phalaenopsis equestris TaxID=78828 RepID=UPI0009E21D1C|nr:meiosis arrest female protein 1 homolog [Phalaenopsis equestris]
MANTVMGGGGGSKVAGVGGGTADGVYSTAKTSVWWDIENCQVPKAFDAHVIAKNISSALVAMDYRGPVSISAYGDTKLINISVQALSSTGISLNHVPGGIKDASDKKILVDMLLWAVDNQPPANYLLISGDRDFSNALHQLSMRRYNILLAQPRYFSQALTTAAKTVWSWTDLLAGGPPLSSSSLTNEIGSTSEANRNSSAEERKPSDFLSSNLNLAFQKANANGEADNQVKGKQQASNIQRQPNGNNFRRNDCIQYHSGSQSLTNSTPISQTSNSTISNTEALPKAHTNYLAIPQQSLVNSPHKCISSKNPDLKQHNAHESGAAKVSTLEPYRSNDKVSVPYNFNNSQFQCGSTNLSAIEPYRSNDKVSVSTNFNNNHFRPHSLYPPDIKPPRPYQQFGNFTRSSSPMLNCYPQSTWHSAPPIVQETPRPNALAISTQSTRTSAPIFPSTKPNDPSFSSASPIVPDISKLTITQYPNAFYSYPRESNIPQYKLPCYQDNMQGNHVWNHSDPSLVVPNLIDTILPAIHILKKERIPPTEANITDCIRYGELNLQDFDVRKALELAVQHHAVVKHKVGDNLFYIYKGESLWSCVNIMNSQVRLPKAVCDAVLKFLSSTEGYSSMMASRCMYDAASILRRSCLNTLTLGEVLQILNVAIHQKKWILPHSSGWQPLSLPSPMVAASDMNAEPPSA